MPDGYRRLPKGLKPRAQFYEEAKHHLDHKKQRIPFQLTQHYATIQRNSWLGPSFYGPLIYLYVHLIAHFLKCFLLNLTIHRPLPKS